MQAGRLRDRVRVVRKTDSKDATTGNLTQEWNDIGGRWAKVKPITGAGESQDQTHDQVRSVTKFSVTLRSPTTGLDITELDRLVYRGKTLAIEEILETVPNVLFELTCKETR